MQISGNAAGLAYDVAIAKKAQQSTRLQGEQAVELIQSATSSSPRPPSGDVGTRLNVVA
jgi:hypothetical protein